MSDYGSDDGLDYPLFENLAENDEDSDDLPVLQAETHSSDVEQLSDKGADPEVVRGWSIMDEQEVEEESETDPIIKEEARRAAATQAKLKICIPAKKTKQQEQNSESSNHELLMHILETCLQQGVRTTSKRKSHKHPDSDSSDDELPLPPPARRGPLLDSTHQNHSSQSSKPPHNRKRHSEKSRERQNKKPRTYAGSCTSDDEVHASPVKRPRGRPRKEKILVSAKSRSFHVAVYIEIAIPHKLVRGRTSKGDKLVAQKPDV